MGSAGEVIMVALMRLFVLGMMVFGFFHIEGARAEPRSKWPGPFRVEVLAVTDGDTVRVRFAEGPCGRGPCVGQELGLRLRGIDTPEKKLCGKPKPGKKQSQSCAQCPEERALGIKATAFMTGLMRPGAAVRARDLKPDPYNGRIVGALEVLTGGRWQSASDAMIARKLASPYDPDKVGTYQKIKNWCLK
jgi:endonuclease YncB( thermonuclease family)